MTLPDRIVSQLETERGALLQSARDATVAHSGVGVGIVAWQRDF